MIGERMPSTPPNQKGESEFTASHSAPAMMEDSKRSNPYSMSQIPSTAPLKPSGAALRGKRAFRPADKGGVSAVGDKQNDHARMGCERGAEIDQAVDEIPGRQDGAAAKPVRQLPGRN